MNIQSEVDIIVEIDCGNIQNCAAGIGQSEWRSGRTAADIHSSEIMGRWSNRQDPACLGMLQSMQCSIIVADINNADGLITIPGWILPLATGSTVSGLEKAPKKPPVYFNFPSPAS